MNKTIKFSALSLILAAAAVSISSCSDHEHMIDTPTPPTIAAVNNISGSVAAVDGTGIEGATVKLTGKKNETVTTDANGYFIFPDVAVGDYSLEATAAGKLSKSTDIEVKQAASGYNAVWNVMLASEETVKTVEVTNVATPAEGETTSEALKGNENAEIDVEVDVPANSLSAPATITVAPVYTEDEAEGAVAKSRAFEDETMLIGATIKCSDNNVTLNKPIDLTFNVDPTTTENITAYKYNKTADKWEEITATKDKNTGKVVVPANEFTSYGIFSPIKFTVNTTKQTLVFDQSSWDNRDGARPVQIGNATYNYGVGTQINSTGTTVFTALLIESLARHYGANYFTTKGSFPINASLPVGTWLTISGTQEINKVTATVTKYSVSGTQYGDVAIEVKTGKTDNHNGGTSGN